MRSLAVVPLGIRRLSHKAPVESRKAEARQWPIGEVIRASAKHLRERLIPPVEASSRTAPEARAFAGRAICATRELYALGQWSGRRDSNSRHSAWKECAQTRIQVGPGAPLERITEGSDGRAKEVATLTGAGPFLPR